MVGGLCGGDIVLSQLFFLVLQVHVCVCLFPVTEQYDSRYAGGARGAPSILYSCCAGGMYGVPEYLLVHTYLLPSCRLFALPVDAATGYAAHAPLVSSVPLSLLVISLLCTEQSRPSVRTSYPPGTSLQVPRDLPG